MMGEDAKQVCPEMETVFVKESRGKADLTKYRQASAQVFQVPKLCRNNESKLGVFLLYAFEPASQRQERDK